MSKKLVTTISVVSAIAVGVVATPAATAGGPPQGGGGCHMVFNASPNGLNNMMAGSAHGEGAGNMGDMLNRFSPEPFCGA